MHTGRKGPALAVWIVLLGCVIGAAGPIRAASVAISPVNISLTRDQHSALLNVANNDSRPVRFSLSTYAWSQSDAGAMELSPTADIIFFPAQLTLAPGEARNVRLGTQLLPGPAERTYRIFLEELPEPATATAGQALHVHVLSRISVPIFLVPEQANIQAELGAIDVRKSSVSFQLHNTGTVHVLPGPVSVQARDAADKPVFSTTVDVWYVLAGGTRTVHVSVPAAACAHVRTITVTAKIGTATRTRSQQTPSGVCSS